ncbi:putative phosphoglycerate mutase [Stackebrandtia endophytica]|uniref:Putative phosphoglycerate mutase n=1 Tax=Stackebrandtia endophytica TaxID=1496996 RepID=A0A543B0M2_9ACTN|nr:histidine phosphatase family protein [Stackebrandtia endophytica]TQL78374.1 putative phosphoglycerate mutase [Stackebrandtia endophytica]
MKRIILLRHGQTEWNNAGRFQGTTDVALDDVGRQQADRAAKALAAIGPHSVFASDLSRAHDTAVPLAGLIGASVQVDPRLRERGYGPWEGLTRAEVSAAFPERFADWEARRPFHVDGIEQQDEVAERGREVLESIAATLPADGTAVVVSHGGVLRQAVAAFLGWNLAQADTISGLGNCCWADVQQGGSGWRLHGYNKSAP